MSEALRVANCSGFYGDRLSAAREMVEGGPIDVLTGDYLAELTMLILLKDKTRDPKRGYARTFLRQLQDVAVSCREQDIKIVVNAGGMNPAGLADASQRVFDAAGRGGKVAYIDGDDLLGRLDELQAQGETLAHLDKGTPLSELDYEVLSANAYLGGFGIVEALNRGADLVICPRVTDAAVVVGPAAWKFGWARNDWDQLAGAVVAGHIIECGAQCTGGNYSYFDEIDSLARPGFPIAEMYPDGSFVITKHEGTDGEVSVGTITAQLLYEIQSERYANPDVVARFDTIRLDQEGPDRVRVSGIRGEPAPSSIKVCMNYLGGYKNATTFLIPGRGSEAKARVIEEGFRNHVGGLEQFQESRITMRHGGKGDDEAFALMTIAARDPDERKVGRAFWNAGIEMALGNYPGFQTAGSSRAALAVTVYWPTLVSSDKIDERVFVDGEQIPIAQATPTDSFEPIEAPDPPDGELPGGPTREAPLGLVVGARSGDKGGNANVGFWTRTPEAYLWMAAFLTEDRIRELYPESRELEISRYELPNMLSINFVIHGLLGDGVSASLRPDPQAKMLGEEIRAKKAEIPKSLLEPSG
ncbi:MAG: acyclic terpene utilization AtuA family protein [Acidobacteriota bacterium]|nr:acyclic terpene utilization AtuA family protein [Acidobacteriota bacterium]